MDDDEAGRPRIPLPGYESRMLARAILMLTVVVIAVGGAFLFIAAPGTMGPSPLDEPLGLAVLWVGIGMLLFGLGWMIRIYRSAIDVEPDHGNWRYRSR